MKSDFIRDIELACKRNGITVSVFESVASTNDTACVGVAHGEVVVAASQMSGRGQRGSRWESTPGENLTASVMLEPTFLAAPDQFYLLQVVSLAVAKTIEKFGLQVAIKWPNDIYVGDRKIAGILIENDVMGSNIGRSVVGVGINVNQTIFDPSLPNPTSISRETNHKFDVAELLVSFHTNLMELFEVLKGGGTQEIAENYAALLYRKSAPHLFRTHGSDPFTASIEGVLLSGELIVRHSDGTCRSYLFKEIEYVI